MDKKIKKVSISQIDKVMKEVYVPTTTVEWNGIEIIVKKSLPLDSMLKFVYDTVKTCTEQADGGYMPELKDFAIRLNVVEMYSNVKLPDNVNHKYFILINSGIVESILENININQYYQLIDAIDEKLNAFVAINADSVRKQLNDVTSAFEQMQEKMAAAMNGIDMSQLETIASMISDEAITDKVVASYIKNGGNAQ